MEQQRPQVILRQLEKPQVSSLDGEVALVAIAGAVSAALLLCLLFAIFLWLRYRRRKRRKPDKEHVPLKPCARCVRPDNPIAFMMPTIAASETGSEPISDISGFSQSSSSSSLAALHSLSPLTSLDSYSGLEPGTHPTTGSWLGVCARHDTGRGQLIVRVTSAKHLPAKIRKNTVDAYVKVCLLPEKHERYTTRVIRNSQEPVFNEEFVFDLKAEETSSKVLRLSVHDFDKFARHGVFGTALLPLSRICDPSAADSSPTGDLSKAELWLPLEERCSDQVERARGLLEVSLFYSASQQTLVVEVIRAKDLKIRSGEAVTLYVKLSWFERRRLVRTRKSRACRQTAEPTFHERMTVPLASGQLSSVCLTFAVCASNRLGARYTIGRCSVGPIAFSTGSGLHQWNTMIHSLDHAVIMWHNLT